MHSLGAWKIESSSLRIYFPYVLRLASTPAFMFFEGMAHMESPTPLLSCSLVRFKPAPHLSSVLCHAVQSYADASNKCTTNPIFGNAWSTDTCCGISLCSEDQTVVFLLLSYLSHSSFELWFITPWKIISSADIATKATNYSYKSWCQFSIYWETSCILCTSVYSICSWYTLFVLHSPVQHITI